MQRPAAAVRRVACVGLSSIGGGLACHFLRSGLDVVCWDPAPDAAERLRRTVDAKWPLMERLGLAPGASPHRWSLASSLEHAVAEAEFVQESVPEVLQIKQDTFATIDLLADPSVVIASATSGLLPTDMFADCTNAPERCVVAHPFHPAYLVQFYDFHDFSLILTIFC